MQKISLSVDVINSVLGYLGNRPYVETAGLIKAIQDEAASQLPEAQPEEAQPEA